MTPSGIKSITFCLVAQYLNQLCHCVPHVAGVCIQTCASIYMIQRDPIQTEHKEYITLGT